MKYGIREITDVVFKAKGPMQLGDKIYYKDEPVLRFDTLKTSSLEGATTTVYAQGGRGNARLISWEGDKTLTFTMEDALLTPESFAILSGVRLTNTKQRKTRNLHIIPIMYSENYGNSDNQKIDFSHWNLESSALQYPIDYLNYIHFKLINMDEYEDLWSFWNLERFWNRGKENNLYGMLDDGEELRIINDLLLDANNESYVEKIKRYTQNNATFADWNNKVYFDCFIERNQLAFLESYMVDALFNSFLQGEDNWTMFGFVVMDENNNLVNDVELERIAKFENKNPTLGWITEEVSYDSYDEQTGLRFYCDKCIKSNTSSTTQGNVLYTEDYELRPEYAYFVLSNVEDPFQIQFSFQSVPQSMFSPNVSISFADMNEVQSMPLSPEIKVIYYNILIEKNGKQTSLTPGTYYGNYDKIILHIQYTIPLSERENYQKSFIINADVNNQGNNFSVGILYNFDVLSDTYVQSYIDKAGRMHNISEVEYNNRIVYDDDIISNFALFKSNIIASIPNIDLDSSIYAMRLDENGEIISEPYDLGKRTLGESSDDYYPKDFVFEQNEKTYWLLDYYTKEETKLLAIEPDHFSSNFYVEGETLFRDQKGKDHPALLVIPNVKVQTNFTLSMASSGDPSTFSFTMDAFPAYTRFDHRHKVLASIQLLDDGAAASDLARTETPHAAAHNGLIVL